MPTSNTQNTRPGLQGPQTGRGERGQWGSLGGVTTEGGAWGGTQGFPGAASQGALVCSLGTLQNGVLSVLPGVLGVLPLASTRGERETTLVCASGPSVPPKREGQNTVPCCILCWVGGRFPRPPGVGEQWAAARTPAASLLCRVRLGVVWCGSCKVGSPSFLHI